MSPRPASGRRMLPGSPFNVPPVEVVVDHYDVDDRVSHDRHGLGRVLSVETGSLVVDFGSGPLRLALPNPKLHKL